MNLSELTKNVREKNLLRIFKKYFHSFHYLILSSSTQNVEIIFKICGGSFETDSDEKAEFWNAKKPVNCFDE